MSAPFIRGGARAVGTGSTLPLPFRPEYPSVSDSGARRQAELKALMQGCAQHLLDRLHPFRKAIQQSDAADVQQTTDLEQFKQRMQSRRAREVRPLAAKHRGQESAS